MKSIALITLVAAAHRVSSTSAEASNNSTAEIDFDLASAAETCAKHWPDTKGDHDQHCKTAVAVCLAESGGNCKAKGQNPGSTDRGLWQINNYYHKEVSDSCAYDCTCNGKHAYTISSKGTSWSQWSTYTSGAYKAHLDTAEKACKARDLVHSNSTTDNVSASSSAERDALVTAAKSIYDCRAKEHYTEGADRWNGIKNGRMPPHAPDHSDCSSAASWVYWTVFKGKTDHLNGEDWNDGYTGTMTKHGKTVSLSNSRRGDLAFYGSAWPYDHVAICYVDGCKTVISHGSDPAGKYDVHYRSDLNHLRSYVQEW